MPLLASLGIVMVPSARLLYLTAGVLIAAWLGVVLFLGRRQPLIQLTAVTLAIAGGGAVAAHNTILLWAAALSMVAVGAALRACTAKCSNLDMTTRRA
jgi:sugar phosphate permease